MVSKASEDLPLPDGPVNTTSERLGMSRSIFLRLCSSAPRTSMFCSSLMGRDLSPAAGQQRVLSRRLGGWPAAALRRAAVASIAPGALVAGRLDHQRPARALAGDRRRAPAGQGDRIVGVAEGQPEQ